VREEEEERSGTWCCGAQGGVDTVNAREKEMGYFEDL